MKERINLTISTDTLAVLHELSNISGKSKSEIIDDLLEQTIPILRATTEIIRKSQHLDLLAKQTLKQSSTDALEYAQNMQKELSGKLYALDTAINRNIRKLNKPKAPASNTGVAK